jgi:predicted dehydrogenase
MSAPPQPVGPSPLRAAVIGAGGIGSRLDRPGDWGADGQPITHAGGYWLDPGFRLIALADTAADVAAEAGRWGCAAHADAEAMLAAERPDVVSLCLPADAQAALLPVLLRYGVRAVVAEKPLVRRLEDGEAVVAAYARAGVPLLVNYTRRFVGLYRELATRFAGGGVLTAAIRYAKGMRHNGVHAIDLARLLFGEVQSAGALAARYDHRSDDPTVTAFLTCAHCPELILQSLDERCFTLFEVDVIAADGRWIIDGDHRRLRRWRVADGQGVPPGRRLTPDEETATGHQQAIPNLTAHLLEVIHRGAVPLCGGADALAAERIAARLSEQARALTAPHALTAEGPVR